MSKLSEGQVEQIRTMRKDGKKYSEIREFFETTYKIKLFDSEIAEIVRGDIREKKPRNAASGRRVIIRGKRSVLNVPEDSEEFVEHIHAAFNIHKKGFLSRVQNVLAGAEAKGL